MIHTRKIMISRLRASKHSKDRIRFGINVLDNIKEAIALDTCNKMDI